MCFFVIEMNSFQGGLTDVWATEKTLVSMHAGCARSDKLCGLPPEKGPHGRSLRCWKHHSVRHIQRSKEKHTELSAVWLQSRHVYARSERHSARINLLQGQIPVV